jgi:hypothetical protein
MAGFLKKLLVMFFVFGEFSHCGDPKKHPLQIEQGVCHIVALPFTFKSILRQKKNYENSNISPCKNIIFKKILSRNQNPSRYHISMITLKFQHKPKYHLSKIHVQK